MKTKLLRKEEVAQGTLAFYLEKPAGFHFTAGQHAYVSFPKEGGFFSKPLQRIFSFVSAPEDGELGFATRLREESEYKRKLKACAVGQEMQIDGPYGEMVLPGDAATPVTILAGGIGITPFFSMIKHATMAATGHPISLFYSNRNRESTAFLKDLEDFKKINSDFQLVATMTDGNIADWNGEKGYIDTGMIKKYNPQWEQAHYYTAGPFAMVKAMKEIVEGMGIPSRNIHLETFTGY